MKRIKTVALTFLLFALAVTACSNASISTPIVTPELDIAPTLAPTQEPESAPLVILTPTQAPKRLPATEAEVQRITVENAKAALDSGKAIIVDVRSQPAYDALHIDGALYIPLADFENNSANLPFDKDQWIITYCT